MTRGTANFLADPNSGDYPNAFKLGSAFSNATLEFQNPIAFNGSTRATYLGGLFTDQAASFESLISGATFNYFVRDASLPVSYEGFNYAVLSAGDITRSTVQVAAAAFAGGTVTNGYTMEFVIVPEPGSVAFAGLGLGVAAAWALRRRNGDATSFSRGVTP